MLASVCAIALVSAAPAAASAAPPTPKSAARIAMKSMPPPRAAAPRRGEIAWLPATYSLSRDPGFTPWTTFFTLGHDGIGRWTLEGTSLGGGLRCGDLRDKWCQPLATATAAVAWQPDGSPLAFFVGPSLTSMSFGNDMRLVPQFTAGVRLTPASLAALVHRWRRN